jgi:hypothetical protein
MNSTINSAAEYMEKKQKTKKIVWLIQSNQITPMINEFLKLLQTRMERLIDLSFIVPETSFDIMNKIKDLNPVCFKVSKRTANKSYRGYPLKIQTISRD